ncbi:bZIP transcription factor [Coccidioides immitis RS]|uniref:BZIP transcription factor n=3 Tax=Coccidioides immitis TaxID=5501 RepID=A0A0E1RY85_COCIM|nr:bZIP transcription factor [Coccidioides immitis RS]EAS33516.2 bZIP transcription factor [Coccidioides immitis RS]KMP04682.1 hypothetical protein CIRG_04363 [Coccidioides immitis RMSCC 2394]KMU89011.1 hypothetical protein CIHG_06812 [Coccidioides immitis H538.4]TPX21207.1 hypothetical protein DIZ76_015162 [Coccidioides immitis]
MAAGTEVLNQSASRPVPTMPSPTLNTATGDATTTTNNLNDNSVHTSSSLSPSSSCSDGENERKTRADRPRLARKPSASILVPRDHPEIEIEEEEFPPDDARAMSPRRNSADVERLSREARETLKQQAKTLQSSLQALAERIDEVKSDHDRLESENRFLQDYIGGLTRTMSARAELTSTSGHTKGRKHHK